MGKHATRTKNSLCVALDFICVDARLFVRHRNCSVACLVHQIQCVILPTMDQPSLSDIDINFDTGPRNLVNTNRARLALTRTHTWWKRAALPGHVLVLANQPAILDDAVINPGRTGRIFGAVILATLHETIFTSHL